MVIKHIKFEVLFYWQVFLILSKIICQKNNKKLKIEIN